MLQKFLNLAPLRGQSKGGLRHGRAVHHDLRPWEQWEPDLELTMGIYSQYLGKL